MIIDCDIEEIAGHFNKTKKKKMMANKMKNEDDDGICDKFKSKKKTLCSYRFQ